MRDALPQVVDPRRLAELNRALAGRLPLAALPRLATILEDRDAGCGDQASAAFELRFRRDASGRYLVAGRVDATLRLRCERCMGALDLPVSSGFTLAVVEGLDEAARLPDDYEPLLVDDGKVDPATLIEDELLLAVPAVPRHAVGACRPPTLDGAPGGQSSDRPSGEPAGQPSDTDNPFAALAALRRHQ
jgi:uncharacterized protein